MRGQVPLRFEASLAANEFILDWIATRLDARER